MTADPYQASAGVSSPKSWNRYAYVGGDPVNRIDPRGLIEVDPSSVCGIDSTSPMCDIADQPTTGPAYFMNDEGEFPIEDALPSYIGAGGGGGGRDYCDKNDPTNSKVIRFIKAHESEANDLSKATGLSAGYILAHAAYESGYGTSGQSSHNNNYFGLTNSDPTKNGWAGSIACPEGFVKGFACFSGSGIVESGTAAFKERYLTPALAAQKAGGNAAAIANAIADAGFNSEYSNGGYGSRVQQAADSIALRINCK